MTLTSSSAAAGPEKIGRYSILGELGRGAMGRVYRAHDPNIGRAIALKVIPLDSTEQGLAVRFRHEAQAAGTLSHPNIVTIFDAGEDDGFLYIAMELVEGRTVQQILSQGPLPIEQVISFCEQAAAALDHAHARGVIHRDIKPANLMVQSGVVKVADFGIAKSAAAGMTSTGQLLGTPQYLAPEVVRGGTADARSDIFSLGIILYEMLTGTRAFAGDNITTVIYRVISEQPPAPSNVISTVPPGVNGVVLKALAKNPEDRYANCADLVSDLKKHAYGENTPLTVRPRAAQPSVADSKAPTVRIDASDTQPLVAHVIATKSPPRRRGYAVAALAAILVVAVVQWKNARTTDSSASVTPVAQSRGADSPPSPTPADTSPEPLPPVPAEPPLHSSSVATTPENLTRDRATERQRFARAVLGRLVIHTEPRGARIMIDGESTSYLTPVNFALAAGRYQITVERGGFEPVTQEVVVEANRPSVLRLELEPASRRGILSRLPFVR
jgi:serine/threonine-protein kinase